MRHLLKPPRHSSAEETERARLLFIVAWGGIGLAAVFYLLVMVVQPNIAGRAAVALAVWCSAGMGALLLSRAGRTVAGSWLLVAAFAELATGLALWGAGIRNPGVSAYYVVVLVAGLLLGERAGIAMGIVCAISALGLVVAEYLGGPPGQVLNYTAVTLWLLNVRWIGVTLVLMHLITRAQQRALRRTEAELAERRQAEHRLALVVHDLGERVKELQLLHAAARLLDGRPFGRDVLAELVVLIPPAWMHTECCEARIVYQDVEVTTPGWRETPWRQSAAFATGTGKGVLEVVYTEERPAQAEGPFLSEERLLIDSLAEMLTAYLERDEAERRRQGLESQLRQAQKMDALGTLAGGIAHDFNNILAAIGGNVELAQAELRDGTFVWEYLDDIARAHARATDLVRRILLFSRQQESERTVIQVEEVVQEALRLLRSSLPASIEVRASYAPELPPVLADPTQIHQIVMNLGTNAGQAMQEFGGVLSVDVSTARVEESGGPSAELQPGLYVCVAVGDTGTGMSSDIRERLFEPFFTTKGVEGTGLGLSVVHGIVREHGGAITVDSELGKGSLFRVYLPVTETPAAAAPADPDVVSGSGEHIMYVDDEEALVFLMCRILRRMGYQCTGFSDPSEALHAFRTNPHAFHAVITDLTMPVMTGVELAQALLRVRPDTPVAIASGYGDIDPEALHTANIRTRIRKPATFAELSHAVRGLLGSA
ncbi:MAG TPA: ATP-binding protein [Longimicrobiaceae bacterium]|nr:ATP-binding protein [Longimicrobiaceae bacterium]